MFILASPILIPTRITVFSDRFIEDGSYMRVKNLQLGYTLPASVLEQMKNLEVPLLRCGEQSLYVHQLQWIGSGNWITWNLGDRNRSRVLSFSSFLYGGCKHHFLS